MFIAQRPQQACAGVQVPAFVSQQSQRGRQGNCRIKREQTAGNSKVSYGLVHIVTIQATAPCRESITCLLLGLLKDLTAWLLLTPEFGQDLPDELRFAFLIQT